MLRMLAACLVLLPVACSRGSNRVPAPAPVTPETPATGPAVDRVGSLHLWRLYGENSAAGDELYQGKAVVVWGELSSVQPDAAGLTFASLDQPWGWPPGVLCYLAPEGRKHVAGVKHRAQVELLGRVKGRVPDKNAFGGYVVILEGCVPAPSP